MSKFKLQFSQVLILALAIPIIIWAFPTSVPAGHAGAPGDTMPSCSPCHVGPVNPEGGSVEVIFPGDMATYEPGGAAQSWTVLINDMDADRDRGFQLTVRTAENAQAGSLTALMGTALTPSGDLQYINHTAPAGEFGFEWTPPSEAMGDLMVYVSGVAANGPADSNIYTAAVMVTQTGGDGGDGMVPAPTIAAGGVVNGASFAAGEPVGPGGLISIFGENFGLAIVDGTTVSMSFSATTIPLPTSLGGYSVQVNGMDAPLFGVFGREEGEGEDKTFPGQINAQLPWEIAPGMAQVVVRRVNGDTLTSNTEMVEVADVSPGIFAVNLETGGFGTGNGIVINNSDGTLSWPEGSAAGVRPTQIGEFVQIWCTGLGPIDPNDPAPVSGDNSRDAEGNFIRRDAATLPTVTIGGVQAEVTFAGLQADNVGIFQVNARVPEGVEAGDAVPVVIQTGSASSQAEVNMAVAAP